MSYHSDLRRKMLELKSLMNLSYKELGKEIGIHSSVLSAFGSQREIPSERTIGLITKWVEANGGGYEFVGPDKDMVV